MPSIVRKKPKSGWDGQRVEQSIYLRDVGTYAVKVHVNGSQVRKTFPDIDSARAWRDEQIAKRPPKGEHVWGNGLRHLRRSTWGLAADEREDREATKQLIEKSPKLKETLGDREFLVVKLPDAPVVRERFSEGDLIPRVKRKTTELEEVYA